MKFLINNNGNLEEAVGNSTSTGVSDAGKIVQLDSSGKLDITMLPNGIMADAVSILTSESIAAGSAVNVYNNGGTAAVRNATANAVGFKMHGYVKTAASSGTMATVYFDDLNDAVTGLTPGQQYLSAIPGLFTGTPPTGTGKIVQKAGIAISATALHVNIGESITLA